MFLQSILILSALKLYFRVKNFTTEAAKIGERIIYKNSSKIWVVCRRPHPAADPIILVVFTCKLINQISVVSLWVSVLFSSLYIDYHVLILYEYVYWAKQRLCDWENHT